MNIIVLGATGSIGRLAVAELLARGHSVTAFARRPETLALDHPALRRARGDAADPDAVRAAVAGQDAVLIVVGAGARRTAIRSAATLNAIAAMQAEGIRRVICQTTLGAHDSWPNLNFFWKRIMFGMLLRFAYRDHLRQEDMVRASGLDWTIVRPSAFTEGQGTGAVRIGFPPTERRLRLTVPRAEVARFLASQVTDRAFLRQAVAISQ